MTDRETMQQALEALHYGKPNKAITILREALEREHAMHDLARLGQQIEQEPVAIDWQRGSVPLGGNSCSVVSRETIPFEFRQPAAQPEPTPWREMVVVSLVREGINKHRARELADHFAAQRPWVGLTKGQRDDFADKYGSYEAVCAIEQALKERNNG